MAKNWEKQNLYLLGIVGIVAIVGIIVLFGSQTTSDEGIITSEDMAGQGVSAAGCQTLCNQICARKGGMCFITSTTDQGCTYSCIPQVQAK